MRLQDLHIRHKQMLVIMLTSTASLVVAAAVFVAYDIVTYRGQARREISMLAAIIGENSTAALAFDDADAATEALAALAAEVDVVGAAIYAVDGQFFARYDRDEPFDLPSSSNGLEEGAAFGRDRLEVVQSIFLEDERVGTVYIRLSLRRMYALLWRSAAIGFLVLLLASLLSLVLSSRLERLISEPILALLQTTEAVARDEDYSLRAGKRADDEIGHLIDGFNQMLERIQERLPSQHEP